MSPSLFFAAGGPYWITKSALGEDELYMYDHQMNYFFPHRIVLMAVLLSDILWIFLFYDY